MTLEGTNTWVLVEPGEREAIVIDPGPDDASHRGAIIDAVDANGANRVGLIVVTHGHADHAQGAAALADQAAAPVRAVASANCSKGQQPLTDGEQLRVGGLRLDVVATPGHTADSVCFVIARGLPRDFASTARTDGRTPTSRRPAWAWSCR